MIRTFVSLILMIVVTRYASAQNTNTASLTNKELVGVWSLVAVENILPDSSKTLPYGIDPQGMLVFNANGSYAIQILRAHNRPTVVANDKNKATAEENAALVQGNNSHYGRYTVDPSGKKIVFYVDHAFYPNWEGTVQERRYTLKDGVLKYIVTNTTNGGAITATVIWKKQH